MIFPINWSCHADEWSAWGDGRASPSTLPYCPRYGHGVQIPMPRVYIVDDPSMNAFATGSNPQNAAVAATIRSSSCDEPWGIGGVIGHEVQPHSQLRYSHLYDCGLPLPVPSPCFLALVAGWCGGVVAVAGTMIEKVAVVWRLLCWSFPCLPSF